uniref:CID domain-containing protein n=1 Tax=Hyaloperonospora arabidopsidis (strain Emoy2) TaxID=559515 RepID=M4BRQ7_HYAAE
MDEFLADLRELDETQERVEAVSDGMTRMQRSGNASETKEMVQSWIRMLRASDFQSERVAFLYVANHVLQKTLFSESEGPKTSVFVDLFLEHLEEAVALVCNSPMDRQNVTRLLELWHEKQIFTDAQVLKMWHCTGEDLPPFLEAASRDTDAKQGEGKGSDFAINELLSNQEDAGTELHHALPMKLNSHSVNPVLDVLKKIDHHKTAVRFLNQRIGERHQSLLQNSVARYRTAADLVADRVTASSTIKQRVEDCLRLVKVRNKFIREVADLKTQLSDAIANMIGYEVMNGSKEEAAAKIEQKLEWSHARFVNMERRKQREEIQRQKDEEIARLHQAAIAESAMHAMNLEADINHNSTSELQSLSREFEGRPQEKDAKADNENELVWNPIRKELVPLRSLNVDWEDWRDH